jgi:hypothetical protein
MPKTYNGDKTAFSTNGWENWISTCRRLKLDSYASAVQNQLKMDQRLPALVAHVRNPSYSGGRDQEDLSSKPASANSSRDPILKKKNHKKRSGGVAQGVGPEFEPQYWKTKQNKTKTCYFGPVIQYSSLYFCVFFETNQTGTETAIKHQELGIQDTQAGAQRSRSEIREV